MNLAPNIFCFDIILPLHIIEQPICKNDLSDKNWKHKFYLNT